MEQLSPRIAVHASHINVGVLLSDEGATLIDCSAEAADAARAVRSGTAVVRVAATHYHRDQTVGLSDAVKAGAALYAPAGEHALFDDVETHWADDKRRWHLYNDHPFPPVRTTSVAVTDGVDDGDAFTWAGMSVTALHTPGHTNGSMSYVVADGDTRVAFVGDVLYDGGRVWDVYSLQKGEDGLTDYHGFLGARAELATSLRRLRDAHPDIIVPSHGPVIRDPADAIDTLVRRLDACYDQYAAVAALRFYFPRLFTQYDGRDDQMPIREGIDPPAFLRHVGTSWIVVSETREAYVMDCGSPRVLDSLAEMRQSGEISAVTGFWITHYHDDHVDEIPAFQAAYDCVTRADGIVADVVTRPSAHRIPCISPAVARVDHVTTEGESWEWNEFQMTAYHFPGQTYYHGGLLVEGRGTRLFFSGDSFTPGGMDDYCANNRNLLGAGVGYDRCVALLQELKPTHIFNCHVDRAFTFTDAQLEQMRVNLAERERMFGELCPWDHPNYALDAHWVRCDPYEQRARAGSVVTVRARVTNHSAAARVIHGELEAPVGWSAPAAVTATIPPKSEGSVPFRVTVPHDAAPGRYVLPADITYDGRRLGPIREAIIDVD